jgi:hypothetical protein
MTKLWLIKSAILTKRTKNNKTANRTDNKIGKSSQDNRRNRIKADIWKC